jgi:cell division septal protein FtsQ
MGMRRGPRARKARAAVAAWTGPLVRLSLAAVVLAWTCWAAYAHAVPYVARHDYFRLRSIRISSDETRVTPQALAEVAGLYDDESPWDVDPDRIRATLRDASWIKHAEVARHFPWQVSLSVSRRHAVAAAVATSKAYLVDEDGVLFHEIEQQSVADLPYLTGWDRAESHAEAAGRLRALLGVLDDASSRQVEVSELHMDDDGTVWLYGTTIKASVRLGDASRARIGLDRLAIALAELGPLADRARVIDTDYRDRIVIRGADDKLPAMLAAQTDKANAPQPAAGETEASTAKEKARRG